MQKRELKLDFFWKNSLHGFMVYMLHFTQIKHDYKREQKRKGL